ncbi:MAG: hypothetical protein GY800_05995 [Planctomycetes bacterium]|nr:hypothetical protein [Planctomycetota bacterium]
MEAKIADKNAYGAKRFSVDLAIYAQMGQLPPLSGGKRVEAATVVRRLETLSGAKTGQYPGPLIVLPSRFGHEIMKYAHKKSRLFIAIS